MDSLNIYITKKDLLHFKAPISNIMCVLSKAEEDHIATVRICDYIV